MHSCTKAQILARLLQTLKILPESKCYTADRTYCKCYCRLSSLLEAACNCCEILLLSGSFKKQGLLWSYYQVSPFPDFFCIKPCVLAEREIVMCQQIWQRTCCSRSKQMWMNKLSLLAQFWVFLINYKDVQAVLCFSDSYYPFALFFKQRNPSWIFTTKWEFNLIWWLKTWLLTFHQWMLVFQPESFLPQCPYSVWGFHLSFFILCLSQLLPNFLLLYFTSLLNTFLYSSLSNTKKLQNLT